MLASQRTVIEHDLLVPYLSLRRWFAARNVAPAVVRISHAGAITAASGDLLLIEISVGPAEPAETYLLPLGIVWEDEMTGALPQQLALARVRRGRRVGVLTDAFAIDSFPQTILRLLRDRAVIRDWDDEIRFEPTAALEALDIAPDAEIRRLSAEQSNSSLIIGNDVMLKVLRHTLDGIHPEIEMTRHLTENGYANSPPLLGLVSRVTPDGGTRALILLQGFLINQGDGWTWMQDFFSRTADSLVGEDSEPAGEADAFAPLLIFAAAVGRRLAEFHAVLAQPSDDPAFAPEVATRADAVLWAGEVWAQVRAALSAIDRVPAWPNSTMAEDAAFLADHADDLQRRIEDLAAAAPGVLKTRIHGDFHLGQVLVVKDDAFLIDFENGSAQSLDQRRQKSSPLRDVAGLLRSFDYGRAVAVSGRTALTPKEGEHRAPMIERVHQGVVTAFSDAYRQGHDAATRLWTSDEAWPGLLDLFLIEKAAYEICYEAANRATWLGVPLRGLAELAARLTIRPGDPPHE